MILLGIQDQEIRSPKDMSRATLDQSMNRDISVPSLAIRFEHLSILESKVRAEMHPTLLAK